MESTRLTHGQNLTFHTTALAKMAAAKAKKSKLHDTVVTVEIDPKDKLPVVPLSQAVKEDSLAIVEAYMERAPNKAVEIDKNGFCCLHYAARYNRAALMDLMLSKVKQSFVNIEGPEGCTPMHLACKYRAAEVLQILLTAEADTELMDSRGKRPLHIAARRGNMQLMQSLLEHGCEVCPLDLDLCTPLHDACLQKNAELVQTLINYGANIEAEESLYKTPLILGSGAGNLEVVNVLLKEAEKLQIKTFYINMRDDEGESALHAAVENGIIDMVNLLLSHNADVNITKLNNWTPLHLAAIYDYADIASILIEHQANIRAIDNETMTPLHRAAIYSSVKVMTLLLENGADLEARDILCFTPLLCAAQRGQKLSVEFLLSRGADITSRDNDSRTCLHLAIESHNYDTTLRILSETFLRMNCNVLESEDKLEKTPLHYAACSGQEELVMALLSSQASPGARDQDEKTPLHLAAENGKQECVEVLLNHDVAEINDDDIDGHTPLLLACKNGHEKCVSLLLHFGADLSSRDENHLTALMIASKYGHMLCVKELLHFNPAMNAVDKIKNTALHHACYEGHGAIVQFLLDHHADVTIKNSAGESALDRAIIHQMTDAVITMLKHKSWKKTMSVRDPDGFTPVRDLIQHTPEGAEVLFNNCIEVNGTATEMTFNFDYVDPSPDDLCCKKQKYIAMTTMVKFRREGLLSHSLIQMALKTKWQRFGRVAFFANVIYFMIFLGLLNAYLFILMPITRNVQNVTMTTAEQQTVNAGLAAVNVLSEMLFYLGIVTGVGEIFIMIVRGIDSMLDIFSWLHLALLVITCYMVKVAQEGRKPIFVWRLGWIAVFLSWVNMTIYLQRLDYVGIYVIMFTTVLKTLLKATVLWLLIGMAFASAFGVVLYDVGEKFRNVGTLILTTISMSIGETEFLETFVESSDDNALSEDAYLVGILFIFVMPVALMNLLVGIAVGDIEKVSQSAYLTRTKMQVDFLYNTERSMPKRIQRMFYQPTKTIAINQTHDSSHDSFWRKSFQQVMESATGGGKHFIKPEEDSKQCEQLSKIKDQVQQQDKRIQVMNGIIEKQGQQVRDMHSRFILTKSASKVASKVTVSRMAH